MRLNTLSGRFAILTVLFVVLAEALIMLPALSYFRRDYLSNRLERAQIASLALLATDQALATDLERELLQNAGVYNVVLRRDEVRQLVLSSPLPGPVWETTDLREHSLLHGIGAALRILTERQPRVLRVIGAPVQGAGELIEITTGTAPLRAAMIDFALQVLALSATFSVLTALLLNVAAQRLILVPIQRVIAHMVAYAAAPSDARLVIQPDADTAELRAAEQALAAMQTTLTGALRQRERLANLGQAVAKISHDLRNILATGQIFADRLAESDDPAVRRAAPKLVNAISRAVTLCETTLAYGKAEEPMPALNRVSLAPLVAELFEAERLAGTGTAALEAQMPQGFALRADRDQLYRVLSNLVRNARQAIEATGRPGRVRLEAGESDAAWCITVADTGPGLPARSREHLFQPFAGGTRKGGTGLGLAIAAELVAGHGGMLELVRSDSAGTEFRITLPRRIAT